MTKHVVYIPFTLDRDYGPPAAWVKTRIHMFVHSCYNSIMQQDEPPEIWLFCGNKNKVLTDELATLDNITLVYDNGYAVWESLVQDNPDHIAVSRIDSDDAYHKDAFKYVISETERLKNDHIVALSFHRWLCWHQPTDTLYRLNYQDFYPQTVTKIFPRSCYSNYEEFISAVRLMHGFKLRGLAKEIYSLPEKMILSVRGDSNVSYVWCDRDDMNLLEHRNKIPEKPESVFSEFGIDSEYVARMQKK